MAIKAGWIQAPEPGAKEPVKRCCGFCRTPFWNGDRLMCGGAWCGCHRKEKR